MKYANFNKKNVLITGGASGMGFEFAKLFLEEGSTVILIDRDRSLLDKGEKELGRVGAVLTYQKDLNDMQTHLEIFENLKQRNIDIDILINNVGISRYGHFSKLSWEEILHIIRVNLICTIRLCHLFLPSMIKRKWGLVLNVSSTAGLALTPGNAIYAATKAFINHFSESIAVELKGTGVQVKWICPGATDTAYFKNTGMADTYYVRTVKKMPASLVAKEGMKILKSNRLCRIIGWRNRFNIFVSRRLPRFIMHYLSTKRFQ